MPKRSQPDEPEDQPRVSTRQYDQCPGCKGAMMPGRSRCHLCNKDAEEKYKRKQSEKKNAVKEVAFAEGDRARIDSSTLEVIEQHVLWYQHAEQARKRVRQAFTTGDTGKAVARVVAAAETIDVSPFSALDVQIEEARKTVRRELRADAAEGRQNAAVERPEAQPVPDADAREEAQPVPEGVPLQQVSHQAVVDELNESRRRENLLERAVINLQQQMEVLAKQSTSAKPSSKARSSNNRVHTLPDIQQQAASMEVGQQVPQLMHVAGSPNFTS